MRQLVWSRFSLEAAIVIILFVICGLTVAGCGHSSTNSIPTTITLTPANSISLKFSDVQSVVAQVADQNGNIMANQTFVWTSSNANLATVTATGGTCGDTTNSSSTTCVCAGTWSSDLITCKAPPPSTPGGPPQSGTATITVASDGLTASINAFVHSPVARVGVTPASVDCLSAAGTQQFTAHAYDGQGNDITSQVGSGSSSFSWTSSDATVVSIDTNGLATAVNPGQTNVYASIAGTSSAPASFVTCPVASITLTAGSGNTFSIAQAATQQITPTVTDTNGNVITITSGRLLYSSAWGQAISVDSTGLATGLNPGNSAVVASCSPPFCNNKEYPVYSNVLNGITQGTTATGTNSKTTQVLVASLSSTTLVPVDITTSTVGTALTLPYAPNSIVYSKASPTAYFGSATELMQYSATASTVSAAATIPGVIVDLSDNGGRIVLYDDPSKTITVYNLTSAAVVDKFRVPTATPSTVHASTSPDGQTTFIVVGNQMYVSSSVASLRTITLTAPATDVAFLKQGSFAYLAGGEPTSITARTTCDASQKDVIAVNAIPDRIVASADGNKVYAIAGSVMNTVTATTNGANCPPALTDSSSFVDLGQGTVSPTQIFVNPQNTKVYMISSAGKLVVYNTSGNSGSAISLANGAAATTGDLTLDGANLWVGGGKDNALHRVDANAGSDAQQISVGISADLVAVRKE